LCAYVKVACDNLINKQRYKSLGHKGDNKDQVRWPITPEVVNTHARNLTSGF